MRNFLTTLLFLSLLIDGYFLIEFDNFPNSFIYLIPLFIIILLNKTNKYSINWSKSTIYFILFFATIFLSLIIHDLKNISGINLSRNLISTVSLLFWPLFFIFFSARRITTEKIKLQFKLINTIGYIIAANCILPVLLFYTTGYNLGELIIADNKIRSFGYLSDQVGFATVYFLINAIFRRRNIDIVIFSLAIIVTGTRGAIIMAIAASMITLYYRTNGVTLNIKHWFSVLAIGIFLICTNFFNLLTNTVYLRLDDQSMGASSDQRLGAMNMGITLFLENPITGVGYGHFFESVQSNPKFFKIKSDFSSQEFARGFSNAQNQLFEILANGGIIALFVVVCFLYLCIKQIRLKIINKILVPELKIALIFIFSMLIFNQTAIYLFNYGISSFMMLLLLSIGNSNIITKSELPIYNIISS